MARSRAEVEDMVPEAVPARRRRRSHVSIAPVPVVTRPTRRRYRQTVDKIDVWTVLKVSTCFYLASLVVLVASAILLWYAGRSMGVIDSFESLVRSLFNLKTFELVPWRILRALTLIGVVVVSLLIVITTLSAVLYNLFSRLIGGIEISVIEDEVDG